MIVWVTDGQPFVQIVFMQMQDNEIEITNDWIFC